MSNHDKDDKDLNDYLEGNSEISKHYRASNSKEPSSSLDAKILSAAKEAVTENKPKSKIKFHKAPWVKPVSIAALITLSVSLIITMQQETGQPLISKPKIEMDGVPAKTKTQTVMPQSLSVDAAAPVMNDAEVGSSNNEPSYDIAPAGTASGAIGSSRYSDQPARAKNEVMDRADKKMMLKEKAQSEALEESRLAKDQLMQSAPVEAEMSGMAAMEAMPQISKQEKLLLEIKSLWKDGKQKGAKEKFKMFLKNNPGYSEEAIKEILGEELIVLLKTE